MGQYHRACGPDDLEAILSARIALRLNSDGNVCSVNVVRATWITFGAFLAVKSVEGRRRDLKRSLLTIVTWLILPVVICLSQRLSHACLSISNLYSETANGSLNQLSFI